VYLGVGGNNPIAVRLMVLDLALDVVLG
jgi:hypothetical protein